MKLPFRRDSIEKVLQDNLRQLTPTSSFAVSWPPARPACDGGQGARRWCRLQVPSMIPQGGFAIVVASNQSGLRLAPKHGMVMLNPVICGMLPGRH